MAETKDQDSPTADDIVDDLAEEMGVDDESASDIEDAADDNDIDGDTVDDEELVEDEKMKGLDGVFDVAKGKKKKKKKKKKRKKKKKKSATEAKPDLFAPGSADDDIDLDVDLDDLDDAASQGGGVNKVLVGIIIALLVGMGALAHVLTVDEDGEGGIFGDLILLAKGEYHEEMERRRQAEEEAFRQAQIDALPRFGTLYIQGEPQDALIRLNGEIPHGQTPSGGLWRELRVNAIIENLSIDETHHVEISHAGHETFEFTITEDHWEAVGADYAFELNANLDAEDSEAYEEFQARMSMDSDEGPEERIRGTVRVDTDPEGAVVKINSLFVRDEEGNKMTTPFEVDEYYAYDLDYEELDEEDKLEKIVDDPEIIDSVNFDITTPGELGINEYKIEEEGVDIEFAEQTITVDTPPRRGNSVQIMYPKGTDERDEYPTYATMLQRGMWDCEWKDDDERERLGDDAHIQEHCNYAFDFDIDFPELMDYIERREEERRRIEEQREQLLDDEDLGFEQEDFERDDMAPDDLE